MPEIVLLTLEQRREPENNVLFKLFKRLKRSLALRRAAFPCRRIELPESITVIQVSLPLTGTEILKRGTGALDKLTARIAERTKHETVYLPGSLELPLKNGTGFKRLTGGGTLLKALVPRILEAVYTKRGKELGDRNLLFIQGEEPCEMFELIKLVAPSVRYVTAAVRDREEAEKTADAIYDEYGLPVGLSTEARTAVKDADVTINLAGEAYFKKSLRGKPGGLIIDLNDGSALKRIDGGAAVRGLKVRLPGELAAALGGELLDAYGSTELAEALLLMMGGHEPGEKLQMRDELLQLSRLFYKSGFSICELQGRHNSVRPVSVEVD